MTNWKTHVIQQLNGQAERIKLPAKLKILTENWTGPWIEEWNQVAAVPYIAYAPEKDRVLMLVSCGNPHQAVILTSDDRGVTWSAPRYVHTDETGKSDAGLGVGLTYMGEGKAFFFTSDYEGMMRTQWVTDDYGQTWEGLQMGEAGLVGAWDPGFTDRDPETGKITRVWKTMYHAEDVSPKRYHSQGYLHWSDDEGCTWSELIKVPQWDGLNEIVLIRAKNGNLVVAGRTDTVDKFAEKGLDHYDGLAVSISQDEGCTWSAPNKLYEWGHHHPSMVVLPNGDIVMSYVARKGYVDTPEGYPQFGVEAVVSHDNGRTWDFDHKYIFATWAGNRTDAEWSWTRSPQATSSVLLPDGSILTAFGTGYRATVPEDDPQKYHPRDVGLINWRTNDKGLNDDNTITNAPSDSDLRNRFDPQLNTFE